MWGCFGILNLVDLIQMGSSGSDIDGLDLDCLSMEGWGNLDVVVDMSVVDLFTPASSTCGWGGVTCTRT